MSVLLRAASRPWPATSLLQHQRDDQHCLIHLHVITLVAQPTLAGYFAGPLNKLPPNNKMAAWGAKPDGGTF